MFYKNRGDLMDNNYGDFKVLNFICRKHNNNYYLVKCCVCGHEKEVSENNLKMQNNNHSMLNCHEDYYKTFIGKKFGDYVCTSVIKDIGFKFVFKCKECGHTLSSNIAEVRRHSAYICKSDYYNTIVGKSFGDIFVESMVNSDGHNTTYKCRCKKCNVEMTLTERSIKKCHKHGDNCIKHIPDSPYKKALISRFNNMFQRCNNPNNTNYSKYGGRGIKLCYEHAVDLYNDFIDEFIVHSLIYGIRNSTFDRIDVNGNYEKDNLRITTQSVQSTNTRRKRIFIIEKGEERIMSDNTMELGRMLGLNGRSLGNLVRGSNKSCKGWTLYKIIEDNEDLDEIVKHEGVTTKVITT